MENKKFPLKQTHYGENAWGKMRDVGKLKEILNVFGPEENLGGEIMIQPITAWYPIT